MAAEFSVFMSALMSFKDGPGSGTIMPGPAVVRKLVESIGTLSSRVTCWLNAGAVRETATINVAEKTEVFRNLEFMIDLLR